MATAQEMKATARPEVGKGAARATRRTGRVPGVIYGEKKPPLPISLDAAEITRRIYAGHFLTTVYEIDVGGEKHRVIPRAYQLDPVKDRPIHVDFQRLGVGSVVRVHVPVRFVNQDASPGIKRGGTLNIVRHTVEFYCPAEIDSRGNHGRPHRPRNRLLAAHLEDRAARRHSPGHSRP